MSKVSISALAKVLVEKSGLSQQDAELFIKKMFDVANQGLEADKQVKMRWLGTFKVTAVKDRESVDVNTGERILIEGRDKITFIPDNILKEIVNKPFAQFETVVVNDGVDFDAIDKKFENIEETEAEGKLAVKDRPEGDSIVSDEKSEVDKIEQEAKPEVDEIEQAEKDEVVVINTADELATPSDSPSDEVIVIGGEEEKVELKEQPLEKEEDAEDVKSVAEDINSDSEEVNSDSEEVNSDSEEIKPDSVETVKQKVEEEEAEPEIEAEDSRHILVPRYLVVVACVVLVALMGGIGWFAFSYGQMTAQRDQLASQLSDFQKKSRPSAPIAKKPALSQEELMRRKAMEDSVRMAQASEAIKLAEKAEKDSLRQVAQASQKQQEAKSLAKAKDEGLSKEVQVKEKVQPGKYDQDARVRTGAYRIVGVAQVVTVKGNQSIASISSKYLGPGMECYVEALNGSGTLKEGQKVKIPKLELKKKKQ